MVQSKSALIFEKYVVKYINYSINEHFQKEQNLHLDFDFESDVYISEDKNSMTVELKAYIFKNPVDRNYPFEMTVCIKGFFRLEEAEEKVDMFKRNATAILFPYLRAIVSTYTANANIFPVILPPVNINAFFDKKDNNFNNN
ncbi:MAG: hypothetical protein HFG79_08960 [Lachnospiraceae bacterium]|jgi:preprotein translocase subunit SecB|nr:hypothetical protein [Lachnospiraceae bacterium]